jgi:hypothetical protein
MKNYLNIMESFKKNRRKDRFTTWMNLNFDINTLNTY